MHGKGTKGKERHTAGSMGDVRMKITFVLNENEIGVVRRALMAYCHSGENGEMTPSANLHKKIADAHIRAVEQAEQDEYERFCLSRVAPFDGD
jgi:hypothetical protein